MAGLTRISSVQGTENVDGKVQPSEGKLIYRGIDVNEIVNGVQKDGRHGFAEVAFLLLNGMLPKRKELKDFESHLYAHMQLPAGMLESNILQFTNRDIMNQLQRVIARINDLRMFPF